ncbi:MAG: hypothetical protein PHQ50_07855 [Eubacteriales bacterium]|nr:hypothetical protein [Eubacteriales bacterium]MDD3350727.1 hypothetical protein [Eubacteriales bacterium]
MKKYARILILFLFLIVYCIGFFKMIAPIEAFPFFIKAITLLGPVFVLFGLIRKNYKRIKE